MTSGQDSQAVGRVFAQLINTTAEIMRITIGNALPAISALPAELVATYDLVPRYYLALVLAVAAVAAVYVLSNSRPGLALAAIREDDDTAEASGSTRLNTSFWRWPSVPSLPV